MRLRNDHPDAADDSRPSGRGGGASRLNLLLSSGTWRDETAVDQIPRLLDPMGVNSIRVESGEEAEDVIRATDVHIALVDLMIPLCRRPGSGAGGPRILQILRRLDQPPPTVVVRPPQPSARESARTLANALREGAFAVLDRPLEIESVLEVMRRILSRYYRNVWPDSGR